MKASILAFAILLSGIVFGQDKSFHDFSVLDINGEKVSLSKYQGKKILVVNTASKCGLTPQYEDLQKLYDMYGGENFVIIGFPANNFLSQEPGSNAEIAEFCKLNYGVSFPMMSKISVKGEDIHPLYLWLTSKAENGVLDSDVKWNFQKYLIDEDGRLVDMASPRENPFSEKIIDWIKS